MNNLRKAAQAALDALDAAMPIIQCDAQMMADITRHAPLDPESQAKHDSIEYESERLIRTIPQLIDALRAALAEPQPEPLTRDQIRDMVKECGLDWHRGFVPLFAGDDTNRYEVLVREAVERFAAPQASLKPLGYEQIVAIWQKHMKTRALPNYEDFARAIERAHGIGNENP